jgi:hypothetical protein
VQKQFTERERQSECRKYEGKYIGYYSQVYFVESCKRREITDPDLTQQVSRQGVTQVTGDTLVKLEEGKVLDELKTKKLRSCAELAGHYVTFGGGDVYFVEKCAKRPFADWETFLAHRSERKRSNEAVLELSKQEFDKIPTGKEVSSVLDKVFKDLLEGQAEVHVIPVDEACKGLNGKYVSYYSQLYKIENCRKRPLDVEAFLAKNRNLKFQELSSEQWLSLPEGKALQ